MIFFYGMIISLSRSALVCSPVYRQSFLFSAPKLTAAKQASFAGRRAGCCNLRAMSASSSNTVAESKVPQQEIKLLDGEYDNYGGVVVKMNDPMDPKLFVSMLKSSISHWRNQRKKGVWIKLPIELANLVEPTVKEGFWFHHAERSYLMLVYWIPGGVHTLPANASHRVCVGAFIMNEKRELLVVQENSGRYRGKDMWKIPTGVVEQGEDICVAAVREVKEETTIEAEFVEVLAFRQSHQSLLFGKSDLFFLCILRPLSLDVKTQGTELERAQWMPLEEYLKLPYVQTQELTKYIVNLGLAKMDGSYHGFSPVPTTSTFSNEKNFFYLNTVDLKHSNI